MINEQEVMMYLKESLPDIAPEEECRKSTGNVYKTVHLLLDYTFNKVKAHNYALVKKCFSLADKLYSKGNKAVKCAIENVFVFSFSHIPAEDRAERNRILGLIPGNLYSVYMCQVLNKGV